MQENVQKNIVEKLQPTLQAVHSLILLRNVLNDQAGQAVIKLLHTLVADPADPTSVALAYSEAFYQLIATAQTDIFTSISDAWQSHLITRLLEDTNHWSSQIETLDAHKISPALRAQAKRDLLTLQNLFKLDAKQLWEDALAVVTPTMPVLEQSWAPWYNLAPFTQIAPQKRTEVIARIAENQNWASISDLLEDYWSSYGTGPLARYNTLRWRRDTKHLAGIAYPDTIQMVSLIGQERQQVRIQTNLERFINGLPAHDMLLYGPPGTGKSSTIKAFANYYSEQHLCLVEVKKEDISDLPSIVAQLRVHAPRYLIFIDDLSFEEHETSYKVLKVLLEGTAEARPENILICATSNRMNLVRENFTDRGKPTDDINWRDTMDEKQSLVHRFGLRVTFLLPDQSQYLQIISGLLEQRGLQIDEEILRQRAVQWERQRSSRSGRSARQFVDELEAEIKIQNKQDAIKAIASSASLS